MADKDKYIKNLTVENARIAFRNFAGKKDAMNTAGSRKFLLLLDVEENELAAIAADGWNVKFLKPRTEEDVPQPFIEVTARFDPVPPKITMISGQGKTILDEDNIETLDYAEIKNIDLIVSPYKWTVGEKSGIRAYVKTMYVTIAEDEFASKYYDTPDAGTYQVMDD